ncbi:hypothetical protein [Nonomuraea insulae]|uniref:Uncharacterized protein n=1 Tax=Nonomuraea insulae TaxID=1616787 RepID=A0ABW1CVK6_9ACTN
MAASGPICCKLLTREIQGRSTAAAIPDVLAWGVPAAVVLAVLMVLLPRSVDRPAA